MAKIENDVSAIRQEIKDMRVTLDRIEVQTRLTNGKVAEAMINIALVKQAEETCPARVEFVGVKENKDWELKKATLFLTIVIIIINCVFFYIQHLTK